MTMHDRHLGNEHTSKAFDAEFTGLIDDIRRMGDLSAAALSDVLRAFERGDVAAAEAVLASDHAIDAIEERVNAEAIRLLALRQPIARDLREIIAALRIATAIERIGDYAANIAKRVRALAQTRPHAMHAPVLALGAMAARQLADVLTSWRDRDSARAERVWHSDSELDRAHGALFAELLEQMAARPENVPAGAHLMFIARNLERIGDHATNIAEHVHYAVTGENFADARAKQDLSSSMV